MSDIIEKLIKDLQKGCKDIDNFNKELLKNIDKSNKEVLELIAKVLQLRADNDPRSPERSRTRTPGANGGGIWNPFDD